VRPGDEPWSHGGHDLNLHAVVDLPIGLVERHHDGAAAAAHARAFNCAVQLAGAIGRRQLEAYVAAGADYGFRQFGEVVREFGLDCAGTLGTISATGTRRREGHIV